jgi:hypothetical protein
VKFARGPEDTPAGYAKLLEATYPRIKEARPDVTVAGGFNEEADSHWWPDTLDAGALEHLDVATIHPYRNTPAGLEGEVADMRSLMAEYGEPRPVWFTELGWTTSPAAPGTVSPTTQARYVTRSHARSLAGGLGRYYWYNFMDDEAGPNPEGRGQFGLIRAREDPKGPYTPKPSFAAYATVSRQLANASHRATNTPVDAVHSYVFERDGEAVRVLWSTSGPQTVRVEAGSPLRVTEMGGESATYRPQDGSVWLTLSRSPVYVAGSVSAIESDAPVSLSAGTGVANGSVPLTLSAEGADAPVSFTIADQRYRVSAGDQRTVRVPVAYAAGDATVVATAHAEGDRVGRLLAETEIVEDSVLMTTRGEYEDGTPTLRVDLENVGGESVAPTALEWSVGSENGRETLDGTLETGQGRTIGIQPPDRTAWRSYNASLTVEFADRSPRRQRRAVSFNPVTQGTPTVDASVDAGEYGPGIDLGAARTHDLSGTPPPTVDGTIHFAWDDEHLYLAGTVEDDVHNQSHSGGAAWQGDSIQVGIAGPDATKHFSELTVALTPVGAQVFHQRQPEKTDAGVLSESDVQIHRDDDAGTTTYEAAIPWSAVAAETPGSTTHRSGVLSVIVNDNDGSGRTGWVAWAAGLGTGKDVRQFQGISYVAGAESPGPNRSPASPEGRAETPANGPGFGSFGTVLALWTGGVLWWRRSTNRRARP